MRSGLRRLIFVLVSTVPIVFVSERLYWYWSRGLEDQLVTLVFYAAVFASVPWLVSRYRVDSLWRLLLVVPVHAYLVEGAIVPVLYSGGPLVPFFPAMFTFWHGVLGVVVVWYLFRRWLLAERWRPLLFTSATLGLYWGMWALTAQAEVDDADLAEGLGHSLVLLDARGFAVYAAACTAALAAAHWLLGRVWVATFEPSRMARWVWLAVVAGAIVIWTVAIPWAAPMFAAYAGLQVWALRRTPAPDGPSLLEQLDGPVRIRALWPLTAIPLTAAFSHRFWLDLGLDPDDIENWIFIGSSSLQALAGMVVLVWSHRWARSVRRGERAVSSPDESAPDRSDRKSDARA